MTASGCVSKCSAKLVSSLLIWRFSSAMMPTVARVVAANAAVTIALAPNAFERGLEHRRAQPGGLLGAGGAIQHPQGVAVGEVLEGLERGRVVLAQRAAQRVGLPVTRPDQALVCPGQYFDRLGISAVAGDRAMVVSVAARPGDYATYSDSRR